MSNTTEHSAPLLRDPQFAQRDHTRYRVDIGNHGGVADIDHVIDVEDPIKYKTTTTANIYGQDELVVSIEQEFLRENGGIRALVYRSSTSDGTREVSREEAYFSGTQHIQFGGKVGPFATNLVPLAGGLTMLRGLEFTRGRRLVVDIWLGFSVSWPVEVRIAGKEQLQTRIGEFSTWTVRIRPSFSKINGLLDKIVAGILPEFTMRFDVTEPHRLVAMSFPTGPFPWNPKGNLEISEVIS